MTDDAPFTAQRLQLATARALPPEAALDAETAALRESFLQLGGALEAAAGDFDEAALVARLTRTCQAEQTEQIKRPTSRLGTKWTPLVLAAALAASALVAIVRTVAVWPEAQVATTAPAKTDINEGRGAIERLSAAAWTDPLDDEIASAQVAVDQLTGRASDLDGSLDDFGSRLQSLAAELEGGSL